MIKNLNLKIFQNYCISMDASYELLRESSDNFVYLVKDNYKKYVLRVSKRILKDDINFELTWINTLKKHNVLTAPIVINRKNDLYSIIDNTAVCIFGFISGYQICLDKNQKPDLNYVKSAAKELVNIHNQSSLLDINIPRKRTIFSELERVLKNKKKVSQLIHGKEFITQVNDYLEWGKSQKGLVALVHNDFRPGNVIFDDKNRAVIIDFDWSCKGLVIKDLAHGLVEWSFPDGSDNHWIDVFKIFLNTYNQFASSPYKLDSDLYRWMSFSCLSDAATFICDRLELDAIKDVSKSYMYSKYKYFSKF